MPRHTPQYILLAVILSCALWMRGYAALDTLKTLSDLSAVPTRPFTLKIATRTIDSGPWSGYQVLAVNGKVLRSVRQFEQVIHSKHPGGSVTLTLSAPDGHALETPVIIPSQKALLGTFDRKLFEVFNSLIIPFFALALGALVVAVRPADGNAWVVLCLMISFAELLGGTPAVISNPAFIWSSFWAMQWSLLLMIFGIWFPERAAFDKRLPWLKYLLIVPFAAIELAVTPILTLWINDINAAMTFGPLYDFISQAQIITSMMAVGIFFVAIGHKSHRLPSADDRRRLRILLAGSFVSMTPLFLIVLYGAARGTAISVGIPWPVLFFSLICFGLFPVSLAYVIVVQRAMDLRFVIRQSVQYGLARGGLWAARFALIAAAVWMLTSADKAAHPVRWVAVGIGVLVFRKHTADRASQWVDRRFFREACHSEQLLGELAAEAGHFIETQPLLERVSRRISETLHVPDIVILIRAGEFFVPRHSTRPGQPVSIPADSRLAHRLQDDGKPQPVDLDKPADWLRHLNAADLQALDLMRTQLLLPITGHGQLAAIMSLGPKRSETPYSATDIRLLQAVTSQMALALENSRLVASLAHEAAERERSSRELEIAREVQERLFPQNFPPVPGLDCAGCCRPARGVGGDYYDFLKLDDGRLGVAVGDVSGKGIAAALLMASLQASLRGQTLAGLHDLSALMQNVNRLVYDASTSNRYATFFYGEYNSVTRRLDFVNAGHNPPVILRGDQVLRLEAGGPVVGLLPGARFVHDSVNLERGDILIAFTDGISEALSEQEEEWEEDRFIASAQNCRAQPAKQMIGAIFRDADSFTGAAQQYDDMTLLVMKLIT
jgi:sigma-B regulation protein RsbU (phosphoserine phosphatase)